MTYPSDVTAATPSSPVKTGITTQSVAKAATAICNGRNMSNTTPSNQLTGAGEQSALVCVGCGIPLQQQETYACDGCAAGWMQDDNFRMHGENDNG